MTTAVQPGTISTPNITGTELTTDHSGCSPDHIQDTDTTCNLDVVIRMAFSIEFLDFYMRVFEHSCDAVNTMAAALDSFYNHQKFSLLDKKDENFCEPFWRGLDYAVQWLGMLHARLERFVGEALEDADTTIRKADPLINESTQSNPIPSTKSNSPLPNEFCLKNLAQVPPPGEECSHVLMQLCPACFGSAKLALEEEIFISVWMTIVILSKEGRGFPFILLVISFPNSSSTKLERSSKKHINESQIREKSKFLTKRLMIVKDLYEAADGDKKKSAGA
ncbi:hypothetical protein CVT26_005436 [Gymnopilus dilepis]|uniref:Uncharacterized protein n=1 Tax=Gymnopilus dilepis TaxID=231916 RepID=A0A409WC09_9AGAR|nr:hypothetical protein CVT26_005436 [Gymnopilus dilepis]